MTARRGSPGRSELQDNRSRRRYFSPAKTGLVGVVAVMACLFGMAGNAAARIIASSGSCPVRNGFSFPNYGPGYAGLSANQMRALFGSGVCAFVTRDGRCVLTPPAQAYLVDANQGMDGGHCFGFSELSLLLFRHEFPPLARTPINRLRLRGNTQLQRAIAYTFWWQALPALQDAAVRGTPNQVLRFLIKSLRRRGGELYTMAIFQPGFVGGHAITPYAVDSRGRGRYDVLVYDNNWPGQARRVHFDTRTDTWNYVAGVNPSEPDSLYRGNARTATLSLFPTTPGLGVHFCPFCAAAVGRPRAYNEITLEGNLYNHAHLLIRDRQGRALGYERGRFVSQIPRARAVFPTELSDWRERQEPLYRVPFRVNVQVTVDGSGLRYPDTEHFSLIGPNHDLAIDGIQIRPGERERITLNVDKGSMTYNSGGTQTLSPLFSVGLVTRKGDYSVRTQALSVRPDSVITISDHRATSTLSIHDSSASGQTFNVQLTREVAGTVQTLRTARVHQRPGKTVNLLYGNVRPGKSRIKIT